MKKEKIEQTNNKEILKYFWSHSKKYKLLIFSIIALVVVATIISEVIMPFLTKELIDSVSRISSEIKAEKINDVYKILIAIVIASALSELLFWRLSGFLAVNFQTRVIKNIIDDCFGKVLNHSYSFFANHFSGSIVARIKRISNAFENISDVIIWNILVLVIQVGSSAALLYYYIPILSILLIGLTVIYFFTIWRFSIWKMKFDLKEAKIDSKLTGEISDSISNAITIKLFSRLNNENQRIHQTTEEKRKITKKTWNLEIIPNLVTGFLITSVQFFALFLSLKLWVNDQITVGTIVLVQALFVSAFYSMWNLQNTISRFYRALSDANEMIETINTPIEIKDRKKTKKCQIQRGEIEFKNVNFSYQKGVKVFDNLNLKIKAGEKVGIVGQSGAGKTTITKLLFRFLDIKSGEILIDKQNIADLKQDELRLRISYVPQDPILFHRSLFENIHYGDINNDEKAVIVAAKNAKAYDFIKKSKAGFETLVGERGVKLSGGEKQRIAIARAMLKNTPILILDEATSALDSESETLIQQALEKLMKNRTTLVIAHRLSTVKDMDRIIVFEEGSIIEQGSHNELINKKGKYFKLWQQQTNVKNNN